MDVVESRGMTADGVTKAEECRKFHAVLAHGEEVLPAGREILEGDGCPSRPGKP